MIRLGNQIMLVVLLEIAKRYLLKNVKRSPCVLPATKQIQESLFPTVHLVQLFHIYPRRRLFLDWVLVYQEIFWG